MGIALSSGGSGYLKLKRPELSVPIRVDRDVGDDYSGEEKDPHRTGDAELPPLVLVLKVRCRGPLRNSKLDLVPAFDERVRDLKLCRQVGV